MVDAEPTLCLECNEPLVDMRPQAKRHPWCKKLWLKRQREASAALWHRIGALRRPRAARRSEV